MFNHARKYVSRTRAALAGAVVCGTLVLSLGMAVPSSYALGSRNFCQTILTFQKLAVEAPNDASRTTLNEVVKILTYEATDTSFTSLAAYIKANSVKFDNRAKTLGKDIAACA